MVEGPVSKRRFSRRVVRQAIISGVSVVVVLVLGAAGWHLYNASLVSTQESDQQQLDAQAKSHAQTLTGFFDEIFASLSGYAAREDIKALFAQGDSTQLLQEAQNAMGLFPSALKIRLLLPRQYEQDSTSRPPLSFGSIDILNRAERSTGAIAAEVLLFGTDDQHIVMVERVKNQSDQLIGIVHLSLDVQLLEQALSRLSTGNGYLEIRQSASGKPLVLGQAGDAGHKTDQPVTTSIAGTRWTLAYWGDARQIAEDVGTGGSNLVVMGIAVFGLVVVCTGLFVVLRQKHAAPAEQDDGRPEISYAGAVRAIMDGAHPGMGKLIANLPESGIPADEFVPGISEGLDGADITRIMRKDNLKPAVAAGDVLDLTKAAAPVVPADRKPADKKIVKETTVLSEVIFRKYDIRGVVGDTLTPEVVTKIGQAIGTAAEEAKQKTVVVGRDGRLSSPELASSLINGLQAAGRDVIDIGVVPTPVLYFATHHFKTGNGVMVTGSHNGPEYNGLKIVLGDNTLSEDGIMALYRRITKGELVSGNGSVNTAEILADYVRRITEDIPVALGSSYKLVVDCGNGAAGVVAPQLYKALGHDVIELFCDLDGRFPNHHPDPSQPKNLQPMIDRIKQEKADLGFAFDGDGDRLGVVDGNGNIIWPDRQMMVFAADVLSRNQGAPIIFDVKCSSHLKKIIEDSGGKALMWKTGHSLIKSKMKETNAPLAGEMSGHIFFKERWYGFDDAIYAGARLLEILVKAKARPAEFFAKIPESVSTPELKVDMPESEHQAFMGKLESKISFEGTEVITVDGFRVEFKDGWGLIRPSNTTPCLVVRFEADTPAALARIQTGFRDLLLSIKPDLNIPF